MHSPDRSNPNASENPRPPHILDVIQDRRAQLVWIASVHVLVVALGLAVVWWATQSSGAQRAEASGWPTTNAWPETTDALKAAPVPVRPADVTPMRPPSPLTSSPENPPSVTTRSTHHAQPNPPDNFDMPELEGAADFAPANLDVVPRVVEWPAGQGLIETIDETAKPAETPTPRVSQVAAPPALPPGGVRPVFDMPESIVDWLMPADAEPPPAWDQPVALTTGQVRVEQPAEVLGPRPAQEPQHTEPEIKSAPAPVPSPVAATDPPESAADPPATAPPALPRELSTGAFFGLPTGRRTVYLLDASGSLLDTLPFAIEALYRSVRTLDDRQRYAIVFYNGDGIVEAAPMGMKPATRENLTQTLTWLEPRLANVRAKGRPDASQALAHALTLQPDTIILLSDGVTGLRDPAADRRKLVTLLERLGRGVRVHTIQFIDPDPLATRGRLGTLELLASLSGGRHRFVSLEHVQPQPRP